ncbi:PAS domain-containing protein [Mucilaginibacter galii]|uniref:histidine kinase n=1 Tax=Mucilaginibacter galii TaxID=2005073 RepID=A0A917N3F4_9SPHI|nr:PAS domain-containing protein [Mucilaginibacter galii]GGI52444.1 hypothetical protein GCM10011425_36560 [Mucilaginibacter galii]
MVNLASDIKQFLQLLPPTVILDTDAPIFTIAYVNDAYCKLSNFTPRELIGKGLLEAFPQNPDVIDIQSVEKVRFNLTECLTTKKKTVLPKQRFDLRLSGRFETRYWQATNTPALNDAGEVMHLLHQVIDITEAYEQALKERISLEVAEAKRKELEKLFMQAPAGVVIFSGPDFVFNLVNPTYQSFFPDRGLTGKPLLEAIPELHNHPLVDGFRHTFTTGETYYGKEVYTQLMRVPGAPLDDSYWNFIGQARYDDNHQIDGILMFGFEVTEQVLLRKKVEASEERLNLAVENVQSGVYDTDLKTGKSICSLRHAQIFGYPDKQQEWSLEKMLSHIVPEDLDYAREEHISGLEKGIINVQFRIRRLDGEVRWINIIGKVNYNNKNEPVRVVGTTTDITEKIAIQRQKKMNLSVR